MLWIDVACLAWRWRMGSQTPALRSAAAAHGLIAPEITAAKEDRKR